MRFYAAVTFFFFFFFCFSLFGKKICAPPHFSAPSYATENISEIEVASLQTLNLEFLVSILCPGLKGPPDYGNRIVCLSVCLSVCTQFRATYLKCTILSLDWDTGSSRL